MSCGPLITGYNLIHTPLGKQVFLSLIEIQVTRLICISFTLVSFFHCFSFYLFTIFTLVFLGGAWFLHARLWVIECLVEFER